MNGVRTLAPANRIRQHQSPSPARIATIPAARRPAPADTSIRIAIVAGDPITGAGAAAFLHDRADVTVLDTDRRHEAEVFLVLVGTVGDDTFRAMDQAAKLAAGREPRFVIVCDGLREEHVVRAVGYGQVSFVARRTADFDDILRAIVNARDGRPEMPEDAVGWLAGRLRAVQRDVLEPNGMSMSGLTAREIDVLSLLADGLSSAEIGERLNYSERTVKNTIYGVLARLHLRNRAHAVAFAIRNGAF